MNAQEHQKILEDLVNIESVADHEEKIAKYLQSFFKQHGIESQIVKQFPGRSNLIASIGNGNGPKIALTGHEDTVHEGKKSDWSTDPFQATEKDGKLYGRGTTDMKSGLAAMAIALVELHENHPNLNGTVLFAATISEELTQGGAHELTEQGYLDGFDNIIVGEPTSDANDHLQIVTGHKGALIYTVESFGKAAHSSTPELGINAIDKLIHYRSLEHQLFQTYQESNPDLGKTIYTPDVFHGGQQVNSIPDYAYQKVMVRTIPEEPNDKIIADLNALISKVNHDDSESRLKLTVNFSGVPVLSNPDDLVRTIQGVSKEFLPTEIPTLTVSMGSDASQFIERNPSAKIVLFGPGNKTAHQTDEYVSLKNYQLFIQLYQQIILKEINY